MRTIAMILFAGLIAGCQTTTEAPEADEEGNVTISGDDLEPMRRFALETRRVLVADFVRIEASKQLFEGQMHIVADPNFVARSPTQLLKDGTKLIILKNINTKQKTNIDPNILPRVSFGENGMQVRAYDELRIYFKQSKDKNMPLFFKVQARCLEGRKAQMWVGGRLQHDKPKIDVVSTLLWDEEFGRFRHKSSIG